MGEAYAVLALPLATGVVARSVRRDAEIDQDTGALRWRHSPHDGHLAAAVFQRANFTRNRAGSKLRPPEPGAMTRRVITVVIVFRL